MKPAYNPRAAWMQAGIYFVVCFALSWATGVLPALLNQPLATQANLQSPAWLAFTSLCFAVEYVAYVIIWPRGTLAHGRQLHWPAVLIFGLLWGLSEGQLFLVIWTLAHRWLASPLWAALAAFVVISAFLGLWHALYWDIHVAPDHNLPEWNGRKVLFAHVPNLIVMLTYLHVYGNAGLFVLFQTFSLMASTYFMRFRHFGIQFVARNPYFVFRRRIRITLYALRFTFMLTHIVLFKLKDRSPANIQHLAAILKSMDGQIPLLRHIEVGVNVVESARAYDIALITRFDSLAALKDYQAHPYHVQNVMPHTHGLAESIVAVDYEA